MRKLMFVLLMLPLVAIAQENSEAEFVVRKPDISVHESAYIDKQYINEVRLNKKKKESTPEMFKGRPDNAYFNLPLQSTTISFKPDGQCKVVVTKETVKKETVVKTEVLASYNYRYTYNKDTIMIYTELKGDSADLVYWGLIQNGTKGFEKLLLYNKEVADKENPYVVYMLLFKPE
jgi:hypothetical protein